MSRGGEPDKFLRAALSTIQLALPAEKSQAVRYSVITIGGIFAGLAAIASIGSAVAAVWIGELPRLGSERAALAAAAILGLLSASLVAGIAAFMFVGRNRARAPAEPGPLIDAALALIKDNSGTALMAALIAGFIFEERNRRP